MKYLPGVALLLSLLSLAGCGGGEHEDLKQWMKESTQDLKGRIAPLPEVKPYEAVAYGVAGVMDPFKAGKLEPEHKKDGGGLVPDFNRPREALESYPLESLKYVGFLARGKVASGVILADSTVHQVKIGNYMGQNFGIIINITEAEVTLRELVQDSSSDWIERTSTLQLQGAEVAK
ncbi:type 4 fimbrial biogenesis protein PilP [Azospira sp. I13]|uniref:pilus assembly protein PilP n=1 Tax=Azospira sp. I13 TaxID=1765050 RepID=UPI000D413C7D|nr:pilus assembly protein PilP [Azospira sp. I13]GBG04018.1 type 4 fimbrial biogenesis protein PilP [Azospira sp. I13]